MGKHAKQHWPWHDTCRVQIILLLSYDNITKLFTHKTFFLKAQLPYNYERTLSPKHPWVFWLRNWHHRSKGPFLRVQPSIIKPVFSTQVACHKFSKNKYKWNRSCHYCLNYWLLFWKITEIIFSCRLNEFAKSMHIISTHSKPTILLKKKMCKISQVLTTTWISVKKVNAWALMENSNVSEYKTVSPCQVMRRPYLHTCACRRMAMANQILKAGPTNRWN